MSEENKDLNNDQVVTDQDLNNADVVDQQNLTDQVVQDQTQDDTLADGTSKGKTVKYEELEKAVKAKNEAQEQTAYAQRQLELMQANAQQTTQVARQPQARSTYEQAMQDLNLTADDLYGENMIRVQNRKSELDMALTQLQSATQTTQQFAIANPDLQSVVGSVNLANGQIVSPTAELQALVAKKPYLANASTPDIYLAMIEERKYAEYAKTAAVNKEHQVRAGVKTATAPMGGSAAGGAGTGVQGGGSLMPRSQVLEIERKLRDGEQL